VVATDGYVRVEGELFELIRQNLGKANLFPFGIGTAVNRFLIEGMARAGKGEPFVILKPGEAPQQAARFRRYIETPVLTDIKVTFPGFDVSEVEPLAVPDLFALRPVALLGKYRGTPQGAIVVTGKTATGDFRREVKVEAGQASPENAALKFLWARERIHRLSDYQCYARGKDEAKIKEITDLGLKYHLMTAYTSFVAVDKVKRADGTVETVKQPLPLPQGVSDLAVGRGGPYAARAMKMAPGYYGGSANIAEACPDVSGPRQAALPVTPSTSSGKEGEKPAEPATATVRVKVLRVKGRLDAAAVQQTLEAELSRFQQCCQELIKKGMKLPPGVNLQVTIGPDGKVTKAGLMPKIKLPGNLATCLVEALKQTAFPKPAQGQAEVEIQLILPIPQGS
jgi:Ca-activated chloride channel family protein